MPSPSLELVSSLAAQIVKAVHGRREEDRIAAVGAMEEALSDERCLFCHIQVDSRTLILRTVQADSLRSVDRAGDISSSLMVNCP
jgi:hypothetical protein